MYVLGYHFYFAKSFCSRVSISFFSKIGLRVRYGAPHVKSLRKKIVPHYISTCLSTCPSQIITGQYEAIVTERAQLLSGGLLYPRTRTEPINGVPGG